MRNFGLIIMLLFFDLSTLVFSQNINQNVNSNTIVIQNQPVIEKKIYIEKYRTVYVDRPQPKRVARRLEKPICLQGYLWVYPEDLGTYVYGPSEIIYQINKQGRYGRNDWRIPTSDELRLMENYANECGLGEDIYLATSHSNGILRLVSTGKTIAEQKQITYENQQRRIREENEVKRRATVNHQASISAQNNLISSGSAINVGNVLWATKNKGAASSNDKGVAYSNIEMNGNWRLPTESEFKALLRQSTNFGTYYKHSSGLIVPLGIYAIIKDNGQRAYIILPDKMVVEGSSQTLVRFVQDKIY